MYFIGKTISNEFIWELNGLCLFFQEKQSVFIGKQFAIHFYRKNICFIFLLEKQFSIHFIGKYLLSFFILKTFSNLFLLENHFLRILCEKKFLCFLSGNTISSHFFIGKIFALHSYRKTISNPFLQETISNSFLVIRISNAFHRKINFQCIFIIKNSFAFYREYNFQSIFMGKKITTHQENQCKSVFIEKTNSYIFYRKNNFQNPFL